jgi:hypothetical protein
MMTSDPPGTCLSVCPSFSFGPSFSVCPSLSVCPSFSVSLSFGLQLVSYLNLGILTVKTKCDQKFSTHGDEVLKVSMFFSTLLRQAFIPLLLLFY